MTEASDDLNRPNFSAFGHQIWGTSRTNVYAAVRGTVLHSKGDGVWTEVSGAPNASALWVDTRGGVYAVGAEGLKYRGRDGVWLAQSPWARHSVWGVTDTDLFAMGGRSPFIARSNGGGTWEDDPSGPGQSLGAAVGGVTGGLYACASAGIFQSTAAGEWSRVLPNVLCLSVWGTSATNVYAGLYGNVAHRQADGTWRYESVGEGPVITPSRRNIHGIWGSGPADVYAAAALDGIYHSKGDGTWQREDLPERLFVNSVWGSGADDIYVAGVKGTILHLRK